MVLIELEILVVVVDKRYYLKLHQYDQTKIYFQEILNICLKQTSW